MGTFSRSLRQYYTARLLSQANIFCLIVYYMIFAVPFYLSFTTDCTYSFNSRFLAESYDRISACLLSVHRKLPYQHIVY
jgi:hypothetical protein